MSESTRKSRQKKRKEAVSTTCDLNPNEGSVVPNALVEGGQKVRTQNEENIVNLTPHKSRVDYGVTGNIHEKSKSTPTQISPNFHPVRSAAGRNENHEEISTTMADTSNDCTTKTSPSFQESETELQKKYAAARAMSELALGVFISKEQTEASRACETTTSAAPPPPTGRGIPAGQHSSAPPPPLKGQQHHHNIQHTGTTMIGVAKGAPGPIRQQGSGSSVNRLSLERLGATVTSPQPVSLTLKGTPLCDVSVSGVTSSTSLREAAMSYGVLPDGLEEGKAGGGGGGLGKSTTSPPLRYQFHTASQYHPQHQHHFGGTTSTTTATTTTHAGESPCLPTLRVGSQFTAFPVAQRSDPKGSRFLIMKYHHPQPPGAATTTLDHTQSWGTWGGAGGGAASNPTSTPLSPVIMTTTNKVPIFSMDHSGGGGKLPSPGHSSGRGASTSSNSGNESPLPPPPPPPPHHSLHHQHLHHHHHHLHQVETGPGPLSLVKSERSPPLSPNILTSSPTRGPQTERVDSVDGRLGGGRGSCQESRSGSSMQGAAENLCLRDVAPKKDPPRALPLKKRKYVENRTTSDVTASADDVTSASHGTPKQMRRDHLYQDGEYNLKHETQQFGYDTVAVGGYTIGQKVSKELSNSSIQSHGASVNMEMHQQQQQDHAGVSLTQPLDFSASSVSSPQPATTLIKTERASMEEKKMNNLSQIVHKLSAQHHREADSKECGVQIRKMALAAFVAAPPPPKKAPRPLDLTSRKSQKNTTNTDSREHQPKVKKRGNVRKKAETTTLPPPSTLDIGQTVVKSEEGSVRGQTWVGEGGFNRGSVGGSAGSSEGSRPHEKQTKGSQQHVIPDGGGAGNYLIVFYISFLFYLFLFYSYFSRVQLC